MRKKIIIGLSVCAVSLSHAACNFTQVPTLQFNCSPTQQSCPISSVLGISCTANELITASLSTGISGNFAVRTMRTPQNAILNYNVYTDANKQYIFGDGTSGTSQIGKQCVGACDFVLYAFSSSNSTPVPAGNYSDNLILTVSY